MRNFFEVEQLSIKLLLFKKCFCFLSFSLPFSLPPPPFLFTLTRRKRIISQVIRKQTNTKARGKESYSILASPLTQPSFKTIPGDRAVHTSNFLIRKEAKIQSPISYRPGRKDSDKAGTSGAHSECQKLI